MTTPHVRIVLQARTSSRRLPAKVLLPLGGFPLAVFCAKRLGNTGRDVVLATSAAPSDDVLARHAERTGIRTFRGALGDVLRRFADCTRDLAPEDIVVRATADNPVPDGSFADALVEALVRSGVQYLGADAARDRLPYGMSLEAFRVGALRERDAAACAGHEREHVTPVLRERQQCERAVALPELGAAAHAHLRCTIDTLEEYLKLAGVFEHVDDPVGAAWRDVLPVLAAAQGPVGGIAPTAPRARIMLGTAQFGAGAAYGIANAHGAPSDAEVQAIVELALASDITAFDTARAYGRGSSEARLGAALASSAADSHRIVTKLQPLTDLASDIGREALDRAVESSVFRSCHALRRRRLDVVMLHRADDMLRWNGAVLDRLDALVQEGVVGELGVSVYTPEQAYACIADRRIRHIQIPLNLLDTRWTSGEFAAAVAARGDLAVYARSVFLQGLLVSDASVWPRWADCGAAVTRAIRELCAELGRRDAADLCIAYAAAFPWVESLVIGVDNAAQLRQIAEYARLHPLTGAQVDLVRRSLPRVSERLLDPSAW